MTGRPNRVSDKEILEVLANAKDPVLVSSEVGEELGLSTTGAYKRLRKFEDRGMVKSAKKAGSRVWWLTEKGKKEV